MLTATYSLVAIAAEQEKSRSVLGKLQQYVRSTWQNLHNIDFGFLENAFDKLMQFDAHCRGRKIELYVIPALRTTGREPEALLGELESISSRASSLLRSVGERLETAFDRGHHLVHELCHAMDSYCNHLFIRFDREDGELLPMARRLLSVDDWFAIAAQFLSDDTDAYGRRPRSAYAPRHAASASASATDNA